MSPDGHRIFFLNQHPDDFPIAMVVDLRTGKANLLLASDPEKQMFIQWCDWANESRLLCSYYGVSRFRHDLFTATRLVAVDADGSNNVVLAQRQQRGSWMWATHQSEIVDWLPEEPRHIYMEITRGRGRGVSRVDIYANRLETVESARETIWGYWSDGRGDLRVRQNYSRKHVDFEYRVAEQRQWRRLHRSKPEDLDDRFWPLGFGDDPAELFVWDSYEGRRALYMVSLGETIERRLVYAHPQVDLSGSSYLGKYRRLIGATYSTDRPHIQYFDEAIERIAVLLEKKLPNQSLTFLGESWDRRFYLVRAGSDVESDKYYRFDTETGELAMVTKARPWLEEHALAAMRSYSFEAEDGTPIPGYLTLPPNESQAPHPTIVLPHGGPRARDEWGFDWLPQFFASQGYVVLQANYRGSGGYGEGWVGSGAYRGWKRAITDIDHGIQSLIDGGIADPTRICVVGWSYGGYAALLSAAEFPKRYRCVVSIAGVSDPVDFVADSRGHTKEFRKSQIGWDLEGGAPAERAKEIQVPVLLFHGDMDVNVPIEQSEKMKKALRRVKNEVEFVEYEGADHHIDSERQRIDMLQRTGDFLRQHLRRKPARSPE
jgi:dipeptidyl aminopeptidase/acylaminoacyl peptidase